MLSRISFLSILDCLALELPSSWNCQKVLQSAPPGNTKKVLLVPLVAKAVAPPAVRTNSKIKSLFTTVCVLHQYPGLRYVVDPPQMTSLGTQSSNFTSLEGLQAATNGLQLDICMKHLHLTCRLMGGLTSHNCSTAKRQPCWDKATTP
jgi:hypothetical protein